LDPLAYVIPPLNMTRGMTLVARMRTRGPAALADIRREVGRLTPGTAVTSVWWSDSISALTAYRNPRFQTLVLSTFAVLALALTALGIFAVVGFAVAARMREIAVRLALGASPRALVLLIVRQALTPVLLGLLLGLVATQWLRQVAEAQLYQVDVRDPFTLGVAAATVVSAAIVAAYLPARQASRVDPAVVLRAE
jgi:ABC-type lipoprotein release transport system permease subunit